MKNPHEFFDQLENARQANATSSDGSATVDLAKLGELSEQCTAIVRPYLDSIGERWFGRKGFVTEFRLVRQAGEYLLRYGVRSKRGKYIPDLGESFEPVPAFVSEGHEAKFVFDLEKQQFILPTGVPFTSDAFEAFIAEVYLKGPQTVASRIAKKPWWKFW